MDIHVRNIPEAATNSHIRTFLKTPLSECSVGEDYHVTKLGTRPSAIITILDLAKAERFLQLYGVPPNDRSTQALRRLRWTGKTVFCSISSNPVDAHALLSLEHEKARREQQQALQIRNPRPENQNNKITRFATVGLRCGIWDYNNHSQLSYIQHWSTPTQGTISIGRKGLVLILSGSESHRIDLDYWSCRSIVVSNSYQDPAVSFTLQYPPKFYKIKSETDILAAALLSVTLGGASNRPQERKDKEKEKDRLASLDAEHLKVAGTCFVYRVELAHNTALGPLRSLLESCCPKSVLRRDLTTPVYLPHEALTLSFMRLNNLLSDTNLYRSKLPFPVLYQVDRLARNGVLPPHRVVQLLPKILQLYQAHGADATSSAMSRFCRWILLAGPETQSHDQSDAILLQELESFAVAYAQYKHSPENPYEIAKKYQHINLIHKIVVTPAAIYLDGVEPEPTNRVLRRYSDHTNHFMRVIFLDEDRGAVRYDSRASQDKIFGRFKTVLDTNILIAGQAYSFLGFSHSSLRSQSCWFMAPIVIDGTLRLPEYILRELGDFSEIRIPAKCAARIGQNFTDTNATVDLTADNVSTLPMVTRNGYDFSDGVGVISQDLLRKVWRVYGTRRALKPTALQIRFQGYKGMVSLDDRLTGEKVMLRSNMKKFEAPGASNLEICGAAFRPLPLILNRQLLKILEDLGVEESVLMDIQRQAVDRLRSVTAGHVLNAVHFLEEQDTVKATKMGSLLEMMSRIGLDYRQDPFLYGVVEMAIITSLRDIKYRGRIPVSEGNTLYGIMGETGFLQEGEVYVVTETPPQGGQKVLVRDRIAISRSPALHPGDIQIVKAVAVPPGSLLKSLSNVIVFSQHGQRDLPSQLSGGDLDGDQFHIIHHEGLVPPNTTPAAEYPRVSAVELDRPVTRKDMSDFFVKFMESDQLGMICNNHLQHADLEAEGTFHPDCIKLAAMASTAVDFSKTGVAVDMKGAPKWRQYKPDYMAPSPRLIVADEGHLDLEEADNYETDPAFADLDEERSDKVLGKLYRAIDEQQFLATMQRDRQGLITQGVAPLEAVLTYILREAKKYGIFFEHHMELAEDIRASYEESLLDILYNYASSSHMPVLEHEAFAGHILGRKGGAQNKPLRELSKSMRERYQSIVEYNLLRIIKGDEQIHGAANDLDVLYEDGSLDREVEALPRAIACLRVAVEGKGTVDRRLGELKSFGYLAAGVCLREYERYRVTTLGRYEMPRV